MLALRKKEEDRAVEKKFKLVVIITTRGDLRPYVTGDAVRRVLETGELLLVI